MAKPDARSASSEISAILAVAIGVLIFVVWPRSVDALGASSARGYINIVNEIFVGNQWLEVTGQADGIDSAAPLVKLKDDIVKTKTPDNETVLSFVRNSYLARDMRQREPVIWNVSNGRIIGLDPTTHTIGLPSKKERLWGGNLKYREETPAVIRAALRSQLPQDDQGAKSAIEFIEPSLQAPMAEATTQKRFELTGGPRANTTEGVVVRLADGSVSVADLYLMGGVLLVETLGSSNYRIRTNGRDMAADNARRVVRAGDILEVVRRSSRPNAEATVVRKWRLEETVDSPPELSQYRAWSGRQYSREAPDLSRAIETSLNRYLNLPELPRNETLDENEPVRLTLDGALQAQLNALLRDYVRRHNGAFDRTRGGGNHTVAVTIMDAVSGDILALGEEVKRTPPASARFDQSPEDRAPPLNTNFRRLPVGSTAKPLIAAAIMQDDKELASFALTARSTEGVNRDGVSQTKLTSLLGASLGKADNRFINPENDPRCDFTCFIQRSSNRYAVGMMLLAARSEARRKNPEDLKPDERIATPNMFELNGRPQMQRALSVFDSKPGAEGDPSLTKLERVTINTPVLPWLANVKTLFNVDYLHPESCGDDRNSPCQRDPDDLGDDNFNMGPWRSFLARYGGVGAAADADAKAGPWRAFYGAAPERENFRLSRASDFRTNYLPIMIGGGEGAWTNVSLAQAYARVVTGRPVSANIFLPSPTDGETSPVGPATAGQALLDRTVWRTLTRAMSRVTEDGGTAAVGFREGAKLASDGNALDLATAALVARGERLGIFSKTGTPQLLLLDFTDVQRAINDLIRVGLVRLVLGDERRLEFVDSARAVLVEQANRTRLIEALEANPEARAAMREHDVSPRAVVRQLINDERAGRIGDADRRRRDESLGDRFGPFATSNDVLVRYAPSASLDDDEDNPAFGKAYVFVAGAYREADVDVDAATGRALEVRGLPQRAFVVAINVPTPMTRPEAAGGRFHTRLGGEIFAKLLRPRLTAPRTVGGAR